MKSKTFRLVAALLLCNSIFNFSYAQVRGMYVNSFPTILGNNGQQCVLDYAIANNLNYLVLYKLEEMPEDELVVGDPMRFDPTTVEFTRLQAFIASAHAAGIKIGAAGETRTFFQNKIIYYNTSQATGNTNKFDVLNWEFEFWNVGQSGNNLCSYYPPCQPCTPTPASIACLFNGYVSPELTLIHTLANSNTASDGNPMLFEMYLGWPTAGSGQMQTIANNTDRILLHCYRTTDIDVYGYSRPRLLEAASTASITHPVTIIPIFSNEPAFMNTWLKTHSLERPYDTYLNGTTNGSGASSDFANDAFTGKAYTTIGGYQWFTYKYAPAQIFINNVVSTGTATICSGASLNAVSACSYVWSTGATTQNIVPASSGTYTVTVTNATGTTSTTSVSVTVNPTPSLSSALTGSRCSGLFLSYTATSATGGTTFSWTRAVVAGISNTASSGNTATAAETLINTTANPVNVVYIYTLIANGCTNVQNVTITVNPTPILSSALTGSRCSGVSGTYTATSVTSGTTYSWTRAAVTGITGGASNGSSGTITETLTNTTASPLNIVYVFTLTANGCTNVQNVTITINPTPKLSSALTGSRCNNVSTTYMATSATSGTTYSWTRAAVTGISGGASNGSSGTITETLINTTANPVNVVYVITLTANGCSNVQNVTITVYPTPKLSSALTGTRCSNFSTTYTATSATSGTTYSWTRAVVTGVSNGASSGSTGTVTETLINTTANPVNVVYIFTLTANGCSNVQNVTITINPTPTLNSAMTGSRCSNVSTTYTATSATTGTAFTWTRAAVTGISNGASSGGSATATETLINTTTSAVNVTYVFTLIANGCSNIQSVTITVYPPTIANAGADKGIGSCCAVQIGTAAQSGYTYSWSPTTGLSSSTIAQPAAASQLTYTVTATASNGCTATDAMTVGQGAGTCCNRISDEAGDDLLLVKLNGDKIIIDNLSLEQKMDKINIYELSGKLVEEIRPIANSIEIATESYNSGLYIISILLDDGVTVARKIVKQ